MRFQRGGNGGGEGHEGQELTVPTHMDVTAILAFRRLNSDSAVTTCRVPVQPSGWPMALGGSRDVRKSVR